MRLAICNETYRGWSHAAVCEHAAATGYQGLEVAPFTLAPDPGDVTEREAQRFGAVARAAGLEVLGLHALLFQPQGLHLTSPDDGQRARTVEFARHLARLCAAMGGRLLVWGSPAQRSLAPGWDPEAAWERAVVALREVAETAAELGVTVAVEPLAPSITNFVTTAAEGRELVRRVDHPACRLHLDVCAMSSEDEPIPELVRASAAELVHVHANDPNLGGPGSGTVKYGPIREALESIGYDGWLSVEVFDFAPGPERIARESLDYLRSVFAPGRA